MENKDRLDEFMRQKFAEDQPEQRLAFREDYWLQAQALIEADERRRRRGFWLWWLGIGLALLLAGWWFFAEGGKQPREIAGTAETPVQELSGRLSDSANAGASADKWATPPSSELQQANERKADRNRVGVFESINPAGREAVSEKQTGGSSGRSAKRSELVDPVGSPVPKTKIPANLPVEKPGLNAAVNPATGMAALPQTADQAVPEILPQAKLKQAEWAAMDQLPLPVQSLTRPLPELEWPNLAPPLAEAPERLRTWRRQVGLVAGGSSALGHLKNERAGFGAGLSAGLHRRGKPWSLNADLFWRFRPGSLSDSTFETVEQLKYSFGYTLDRIDQRVTGTHWLELPLYAQYHLTAVNIEAGLMPSLMLFVQGRRETTRETSLAPEPVALERRLVRLDNRWFAKWHAGVFAGVAWQPTNHVQLGLRLHYQPGRLVTDADASSPDRRPFWADLRVRCLFGR